jgi:hypothetical protein
MDAYQAQQQIGRAKTFAEIRRIEARASRTVTARRPARWPLGAIAARRRARAAADASSTAGANVPCV